MYTPTDREAFNAARTQAAKGDHIADLAKEFAGEHWSKLTEEERESIKRWIEKEYHSGTQF